MKGKSPKEMLGLVAQSTLTKGFMQSIVIFSALILIFTVIPFTIGIFNPEEEKKTAAEESASANPEDNTQPQDGTPASNEDGTIQTPLGETATGNPVIDKLGIGETKDAPKAVNPLDDTGDDLFDELK
jgi:hypothetical protein